MDNTPVQTMWEGYRKLVVPVSAPATQVEETHKAFFAGATSLFQLIMAVLDPGVEATDADLVKMGIIYQELCRFGQGFDTEFVQPNRTRV
jgi:hypothetical protein